MRAPTLRKVLRRVVIALAGVVTVMLVALTIGMVLVDRRIDADPVRTTGTVLTVGALRTGIEFVDTEGHTVRPPGGVLYPGLLSVGQQFMVEYDRADPLNVRVAGRSARTAITQVAIFAGGTWLVAGLLLGALAGGSANIGLRRRVVG